MFDCTIHPLCNELYFTCIVSTQFFLFSSSSFRVFYADTSSLRLFGLFRSLCFNTNTTFVRIFYKSNKFLLIKLYFCFYNNEINILMNLIGAEFHYISYKRYIKLNKKGCNFSLRKSLSKFKSIQFNNI